MKLRQQIILNHALAEDASNITNPIWQELVKEIADSTSVQIFSAFYGLDFLLNLFNDEAIVGRRSRELFLMFGRKSAPGLEEQLNDLTKFKAALIARGYSKKNISIALSVEGRFFHTKIYQFIKNTRRRTYIGSANASLCGLSTNEELMVSFDGRHSALEAYLDHTWDSARRIEDLQDELADSPKSSSKLRSLREFLSNGLLYFRPSRSLSWSLDCFPKPEYEQIANALTAAQTDPRPPFEVGAATTINLLAFSKFKTRGTTLKAQRLGFQLPSYAIETALGYWVPSVYAAPLQDALKRSISGKKRQYLAEGTHLKKWKAGPQKEFGDLIDEINEMLVGQKIPKLHDKQVKELKSRIEKRLDRLIKRTTNDESLNYLCRPMDGFAVPDFWEDQQSSADFITSFCEYLLSKLAAGGRIPAIVNHLADNFNLRNAKDEDEVEELISNQLKERGWTSNDWPEFSKAQD